MTETGKETKYDLQKQVDELLQMQKLIEKQLEKVKDGIGNNLNHVKAMPGVMKTGKLMGTVKLSTIAKNGFVLSPEYYFSDACTEHIMNRLKGAGSADEMFKLLLKMIKEEKVVDKGTSYRLNPNIIDVLKSVIPENKENQT